jgi:hypothetical protein
MLKPKAHAPMLVEFFKDQINTLRSNQLSPEAEL